MSTAPRSPLLPLCCTAALPSKPLPTEEPVVHQQACNDGNRGSQITKVAGESDNLFWILQYYCMLPDQLQHIDLWVIEKNLCGPLRFVFEYPCYRLLNRCLYPLEQQHCPLVEKACPVKSNRVSAILSSLAIKAPPIGRFAWNFAQSIIGPCHTISQSSCSS